MTATRILGRVFVLPEPLRLASPPPRTTASSLPPHPLEAAVPAAPTEKPRPPIPDQAKDVNPQDLQEVKEHIARFHPEEAEHIHRAMHTIPGFSHWLTQSDLNAAGNSLGPALKEFATEAGHYPHLAQNLTKEVIPSSSDAPFLEGKKALEDVIKEHKDRELQIKDVKFPKVTDPESFRKLVGGNDKHQALRALELPVIPHEKLPYPPHLGYEGGRGELVHLRDKNGRLIMPATVLHHEETPKGHRLIIGLEHGWDDPTGASQRLQNLRKAYDTGYKNLGQLPEDLAKHEMNHRARQLGTQDASHLAPHGHSLESIREPDEATRHEMWLDKTAGGMNPINFYMDNAKHSAALGMDINQPGTHWRTPPDLPVEQEMAKQLAAAAEKWHQEHPGENLVNHGIHGNDKNLAAMIDETFGKHFPMHEHTHTALERFIKSHGLKDMTEHLEDSHHHHNELTGADLRNSPPKLYHMASELAKGKYKYPADDKLHEWIDNRIHSNHVTPEATTVDAARELLRRHQDAQTAPEAIQKLKSYFLKDPDTTVSDAAGDPTIDKHDINEARRWASEHLKHLYWSDNLYNQEHGNIRYALARIAEEMAEHERGFQAAGLQLSLQMAHTSGYRPRRHEYIPKPRSTDLKESEWFRIRRFFPEPELGPRNRRTPIRVLLNASLFRLENGIPLHQLEEVAPDFPPWGSVHAAEYRIAEAGLWPTIIEQTGRSHLLPVAMKMIHSIRAHPTPVGNAKVNIEGLPA